MLSLGGEPFTTGRVEFFDRFPGSRELTAKIYINVKFLGVETTFLAQLDTVFLGYSGLLDRLKIGIDPSSNNLFFGLIASEA